MASERLADENFFNAVLDYFTAGSKNGIFAFPLKGPDDAPAYSNKAIIGLFPIPGDGQRYTYKIISKEHHREPSWYYSKVLGLELPQSIRELTFEDNEPVRDFFESKAAASDMPSIALVIAEAAGTGEEVLILFFVWGISPERALRKLQEPTRERLSRLS